MTIELTIDQVKFSKEFYPRQKPDDDVIRRYRDAIDNLPPIEVALINNEYLGVDGYHRILAHKLENRSTIQASLREDLTTPTAVLAEAIRLNAIHGHQLTREDKSRLAQQLFGDYTVEQLAKLLAVTTQTIRDWTKQQRKMAEFQREVERISLYLCGSTEREIAFHELDSISFKSFPEEEQRKSLTARQVMVSRSLDRIQNKEILEMYTISSSNDTDEDTAIQQAIIKEYLGNYLVNPLQPPPSLKVYDVWNFTKCDPHYGAMYPGRIPGQILENLLWYYTEPFSNVYDPFAGSGTTIDVCRAMFRRYWASDLRPFDTTKGILQHDITLEKPDFFPKGYKMDLIFLDPPYWSMKDDEYVEGSISSLPLKEYYDAMVNVARYCRDICSDEGYLALLIQNQTGAGKGGFEDYLDHVFALYRRYEDVGWQAIRRISCPLIPDNNGGSNEAKAKDDKRMLGLVRDLVIFRKS